MPLQHKDLGIVYLAHRLFDEAEDEFRIALEISPESTSIIFEFANFYHNTSNYAKAEEMYAKALAKQPRIRIF